MPLVPQVQAILDAVTRFHQGPRAMPTMQSLGPQAARQLYERQALALDIASVSLDLVEDHQVALDHSWELGGHLRAQAAVPVPRTIVIRQYSARTPSWAQLLPAVLFFHGGGLRDATDRRIGAFRPCCIQRFQVWHRCGWLTPSLIRFGMRAWLMRRV